MTGSKEIVEEVLSLLEGQSIYDKIAIVANVLIREGFEEIGVPPTDRAIDPHNVFRVVMRDRDTNGETIENSMVLQGLIMLDWLAKKKKES